MRDLRGSPGPGLLRVELRTATILWNRRPSPRELADALRHLALIAALRGDRSDAEAFEADAVRVASLDARGVRQLLAHADSTGDGVDPHVSPATAQALRGLARDGTRSWLNTAEERLPRDVAALVRHGRPELLAGLREAEIHVAADLRALVDEQGGLSSTWGNPDETIGVMRAHRPRLNLGRALSALELLLDAFGHAHADVALHPVGGLRRFEPTVGDLLVLATGDRAQAALAAFVAALSPQDLRRRSADAVTFVHDREEVTLRVVEAGSLGCALLHYSGSRAHVELLRARAAERDLRLTPRRFVRGDGRPLPAATEAEIYRALDLPFIPPERRHGLDEILLAERGQLGETVRLEDIRGDLHLHTIWSDGRDSSQSVVLAARALGYEYMAITDHSPSARASRVLTIENIAAQAREIEGLRAQHPSITIFHGCEVDILSDGRLDLPDEVMDGLDIVLASLHDAHGHDGRRLTDRYIRAMQHPAVAVITHPANRVPGRSQGYGLDWARFFAAACDTGTAVEVDGAPGHIDLDGLIAREAVEAGCTLAIDSDGHFAERIGRQMRIGVGTAARGGVRASQVLNTGSAAEVRAFVARKRSRTPPA